MMSNILAQYKEQITHAAGALGAVTGVEATEHIPVDDGVKIISQAIIAVSYAIFAIFSSIKNLKKTRGKKDAAAD